MRIRIQVNYSKGAYADPDLNLKNTERGKNHVRTDPHSKLAALILYGEKHEILT